MKISLVIPVYNEEAILKDTIRELTAYMQAQFQDYEILMVNDGSADRSGEMILEAIARNRTCSTQDMITIEEREAPSDTA